LLTTNDNELLHSLSSAVLVFPGKDGFLTPIAWRGLVAFAKAFPQVFSLETASGAKGGNAKQQNEGGKKGGGQQRAPESKLFTSFFTLLKQGAFFLSLVLVHLFTI
jgi:hypothetical protein